MASALAAVADILVDGGGAVVERHNLKIRAKAADADEDAFAAIAHDRYARNALKRFGDILGGKFADILGLYDIDDIGGSALLRQRTRQAGSIAGNDNFRRFRRCRHAQILRGGSRCDDEKRAIGLLPHGQPLASDQPLDSRARAHPSLHRCRGQAGYDGRGEQYVGAGLPGESLESLTKWLSNNLNGYGFVLRMGRCGAQCSQRNAHGE